MKNVKELRELFHAARPSVWDGEAFMKQLDERLKIAEQVKGYCKQERKRSRRGIAIAAGIGLLCGIGLMLMLIYLPAYLPDAPTVLADAADSLKSAARSSMTDAAMSFDYVRLGILIKYRYIFLAILSLGVIIPGGFLIARKISQ